MINFVLISIAGIAAMFRWVQLKLGLLFIGYIVIVIGGIAVLGYVLNWPLLYYAIEGVSTEMACHTALLFVMVGVSLTLLSRKD